MSQPYLGQINMFGGNFAQYGYAFCNGQPLSISQNTALYALLGTTYGGDGVQTFALPDMRCRLPVDWGQGPGLSNYNLGQNGGVETVTLTTQMMPAHTHTLFATTGAANTNAINQNFPATPSEGAKPEFYAADISGKPPVTPHQFPPQAVSMNGGGQPHGNMMPSLCVTFMIALQGIFPSRN